MMNFLGGLVDSFTGKGARRDIDKGIGAVGQGRDAAVGAYERYGSQARAGLDPYEQGGRRGFELYADTTGANGADAMQRAQSLWLNNPLLQNQRALDVKRNAAMGTARGWYGTPQNQLADNRSLLQAYKGNFQDPLSGLGQMGMQAATQQGNYAMQTGAGIAGAQQSATSALASLYGSRAQTENALAQNIIGGIGAVGTFFGGKPAPQGTGQIYGGNSPSGLGPDGSGTAGGFGNNISHYFG